jgi:catechol 2,3-dioxygenase-like lactoylglutathione lyase family enzyme
MQTGRQQTQEISMKRFHVHVAVDDVAESIKFYSTLFGTEPSVKETDYAKWMLDDPRLNFAVSSRGRASGINHLGFQVDSSAELTGMKERLQAADAAMIEQTATACCYARSDKYWVTDPSGIAWETFHSLGAVPVYGDGAHHDARGNACCVPLAAADNQSSSSCCIPAQAAAPGACCS